MRQSVSAAGWDICALRVGWDPLLPFFSSRWSSDVISLSVFVEDRFGCTIVSAILRHFCRSSTTPLFEGTVCEFRSSADPAWTSRKAVLKSGKFGDSVSVETCLLSGSSGLEGVPKPLFVRQCPI